MSKKFSTMKHKLGGKVKKHLPEFLKGEKAQNGQELEQAPEVDESPPLPTPPASGSPQHSASPTMALDESSSPNLDVTLAFVQRFQELHIASEKGVHPPSFCYEEFKFPRQEYQSFKESVSTASTLGRFFLTLKYEYDPIIEVFRFMSPPSRMHSTLTSRIIDLVVAGVDEIRPYATTKELTKSADSGIAYRQEEGVDGVKVPDLMLAEEDYNLGIPVCLGEISFSETRAHAGKKLTDLLLDYKGKINFGFNLKVNYVSPPEDDNSIGEDQTPAVYFDIYRTAVFLDSVTRNRSVKVEPTCYELRDNNGQVQSGSIKFWLSDFYPIHDWGSNGLPPDQEFDIPFAKVINYVVIRAADCHWAKIRSERRDKMLRQKAKEANEIPQATILKPKEKRRIEAEEKVLGIKRIHIE